MEQPLSQERYAALNGLVCPQCADTEEIHVSESGFTEYGAWRNCYCRACKSEWTDEYRLIGYSNLGMPDVEDTD